jgi:hypothetical protein
MLWHIDLKGRLPRSLAARGMLAQPLKEIAAFRRRLS